MQMKITPIICYMNLPPTCPICFKPGYEYTDVREYKKQPSKITKTLKSFGSFRGRRQGVSLPPYLPDTWRAEINPVPTCISGEFTCPFPSTGPDTAVNPPATMPGESLGFSRDAPWATFGVPSGSQFCSEDALRSFRSTMSRLNHLNAGRRSCLPPKDLPKTNKQRQESAPDTPMASKSKENQWFFNDLQMSVKAHSRLPMTS